VSPIHSIPAAPQPAACASWAGAAVRPRLREHVLGWSGFRAGAGAAVRHRLLPLSFVTLIVDIDAGSALVTGAREVATVDGATSWGHGVTVGLTPAGAPALLGIPMAELTGLSVELSDVVGSRGDELVERLSAASSWAARFALLEALLTRWAVPFRPPDPLVTEAWRRLHSGPGRPPDSPVPGEWPQARGADRSPDLPVLGGWPRARGADRSPDLPVLGGWPRARGADCSPDLPVPGGWPRARGSDRPSDSSVGGGWPAGSESGRSLDLRAEGWPRDRGSDRSSDSPVSRGSPRGLAPDPMVAEAWWRLQRGSGRVDAVARELGVSRRYLQQGFRCQIGLPPAAVARIARLQRAIHRLSRGSALLPAAVDSGYADQPHLNRSMRAMTGLTPGELRAFVQYQAQAGA